MMRATYVRLLLAIGVAGCVFGQTLKAADWLQFRGPGGLGRSDEKGLPLSWGTQQNVVWKTELPGPGASSPIVVGQRGDVTHSHVLWKAKKGSNVSSPLYHDGYLYFSDDVVGIVYCLDVKKRTTVRSAKALWFPAPSRTVHGARSEASH
jgi:hypothetical protein